MLQHDAVDAPDAAQVGSRASYRGQPHPMTPPHSPGWAPVHAALRAHTYEMSPVLPGLRVLATSDGPLPTDGILVARGTVVARLDDPQSPGRHLVVLSVSGWDRPLVFG